MGQLGRELDCGRLSGGDHCSSGKQLEPSRVARVHTAEHTLRGANGTVYCVWRSRDRQGHYAALGRTQYSLVTAAAVFFGVARHACCWRVAERHTGTLITDTVW